MGREQAPLGNPTGMVDAWFGASLEEAEEDSKGLPLQCMLEKGHPPPLEPPFLQLQSGGGAKTETVGFHHLHWGEKGSVSSLPTL